MTGKPSSLGLAISAILGVGTIWGFSYPLITVALHDFTPFLLGALRFDVVAIVLLGAAAVWRFPMLPRGKAQWSAVAVGAVLNITFYHAFLFWGQGQTSPGIAAVIVGLNPILAGALSRAFVAGERTGLNGGVGLALGFLGILLLAALKPGPFLDARGVGELAVAVGILCWAAGTVAVKATRHSLPPVSLVAWQSLLGAAGLHVASLAFEPQATLVASTEAWASLAYLALAASCIGLPVFFWLLDSVGATRSNLASYVSAIVAPFAAWAFFGHALEARSFVAFALILAGFLLVMRPRMRVRLKATASAAKA